MRTQRTRPKGRIPRRRTLTTDGPENQRGKDSLSMRSVTKIKNKGVQPVGVAAFGYFGPPQSNSPSGGETPGCR